MSGLREAFDEIVADVPVYGDLDRAIEQAGREQRRHNGAIVGLAAAAAVVAAVAGAAVFTDDETNSQGPIGPATTSPTPTPTASTSASATWEPPEPLRPAASRVVQVDHDVDGNPLDWGDPRDAAVAEADIVSVSEVDSGSSWHFQLAARPPLDPADRVIAYGVVVDGDGDHRADCQIGINNDAPEGGFRVWVTNLRNHETAVQDGPPYGMPVEFVHPAEALYWQDVPVMWFTFLRGMTNPGPCDPLGDSSTFYAWSSVMQGGQVVARDYAPDAAWMPIRWGD